MPQLDFFTFPHQYLIASLCFCGLYYFNLLYFFNWIKYLYLTKFFALKGYMANQVIILGDFSAIIKYLLEVENFISFSLWKWNKRLQKSFFLKWIGTKITYSLNNNSNLLGVFGMSFLILLFFLKNFLIFNAEKLMLVYFLLVITTLFFFSKKSLKNFIEQDIWKFLILLLEVEWEGSDILVTMKNFYTKLQREIITNFLELCLIRNFEFKVVQKVRW